MKSIKKFLKEDKKAKTKSFFLTNRNVYFNNELLKYLEDYYKKNFKDVRICLHEKPTDKQHDMIILQQRKNFYKPHKHLKKGETYHIMKGSMACVLFSNNGKINKICKINKSNIFRTPINTYHTMLPISKFVIYHESKPGPFLKKNDSIYPKWIKKYLINKNIDLLKEKVKATFNG